MLGADLVPSGEIVSVDRELPEITIGYALVKGQRPEWITQKLTELGVDAIVPFAADRGVARWDEARATKNHERLVRVSREAAMQSRRVHLPVIEPFSSFNDVVSRQSVALADAAGEPPSLAHPAMLIGPEGGWSIAEREGRTQIRLTSTVLRAETAAIAAATLLVGIRSRIVLHHAE